MKNISCTLSMILLFLLIFLFSVESKSSDPYKILGVSKDASQREIQKAFHKLSLQYHPDKNKNKGAQEKFAEINNAYDILSDEEKRKNYDMYGDVSGHPGFDGGNAGEHGGYTYFKSGGPGGSNFRPDEWHNMGGGQGGYSKSYSFSFGGPSQGSFGFDFGDVFSNMFGGGMNAGSQFGGFGGNSGKSQFSQSGPRSSPKTKGITSINSQLFKKDIADKGLTWILLCYKPSNRGVQHYESLVEEAASSLQGVLKVGSVNCEAESSLCKELGVHPRNLPKLFVYSYSTSDTGSLVEYTGDETAKDLRSFCMDHLPRFSKRVHLNDFHPFSGNLEPPPAVMLLSTKKSTPIIWRALSGLYRKRFLFYDAEVDDASNPMVRKLGVDALPAIVGWLSNGEKEVLRSGIRVTDIKSAIQDLSALLASFEKRNKKAATTQGEKSQADSDKPLIPLLTASTFDDFCGDKTPVCIIGVFRSSKGMEKLHNVLSSVSQKSLIRRENFASGPRDSISYALLDASRHSSFLYAFDKLGFKSSDKLVLAYKPRKGKFAAFTGTLTSEEIEKFVGSVLNGDVQFKKTRQKPSLK